MLHHNGINREQDTPSLRQAQQDGLVVGSMAAGFEAGEAGKKFRVAIDETSAPRDRPGERVRGQSSDARCGRVRGLVLEDKLTFIQ